MNKITYKLFLPLIVLVLLFPIFKENISSFILILLSLNTIIYKISLKDYSLIKPKTLLLTIPFWIVVVASFFSNDFKESSKHIQHSLFFLVVPIVFSLIPKEFFSSQKVNLYISVLKNLCLLIAIIYLVSFLINIPLWRLNFQDGSIFRTYIYSYFKLFVIHPTYYTAILILCVAHSMEIIIKQKKYWHFVYVAVFLGITFLLLAKLNIFIMLFVIALMLFLRSNFNFKQKVIIGLFSFAVVAILFVFTPGLKTRLNEVYNSFNSKPKDLVYNSTNIRKAVFDCSIAIAKDNYIKGIGFENLQNKLNDCYKANYDSSFYKEHNYMTHNYYFYILLSSGLLGFIFYLIYLINIIRICIKTNLFLFFVFLLSSLTLCFFEDYFYRQFGSLFFNSFLMIFIQYSENLKKGSQLINR